MECRNKIIYEALGIHGYIYGHDGYLVGWTNEPDQSIVLDFSKGKES